MTSRQAAPQADRLDQAAVLVAVAVALGSVLPVVDNTVVNVALQALAVQFHTSLDTLQWLASGYMLALAAVIPLSAWSAGRFGAKRVYLAAIAVFTVGSMLTGAAWDIASLIGFRVLQGLGGGLLSTVGVAMLARAAGPGRIGRMMSIISIPVMLGPIFGPVLGGWLVDTLDWRWVFFVNAPIGLAAVLVALRVLPADGPGRPGRLDFVGLAMASPGTALLIYGVSNVLSAGGVGAVGVWLPIAAGLALIGGFVLRANRIANPLVDLRLFRDRTFTLGAVAIGLFYAPFLGVQLLIPTYFQLVHGESALVSGLMLAPQGIGAIITMPVGGRLVDRFGPRWVVLPGLLTMAAGLAVFVVAGPSTPYWVLVAALLVLGLGLGVAVAPMNAAALRALAPDDMAMASTTTNMIRQTSGAIGAAVFSIVLAGLLAARFGVPASQGQAAATTALAAPATHAAASVATTDSFATTFLWAIAAMVVSVLPVLLLPRRPR
ncbi:DHA2 family efflux MFS transporter permease subunit [Kutzneria sp. NPDC052558]|uniref:DHA2 family efflux MFS transporter permease subunit n=1 Tax=Kutzneria sp. NPDC052558 TaxID=3364121 RepID=UPI0037C791E4